MDVHARRRAILTRARGAKAVQVGALAEDFEVSLETIRRDLRTLEASGEIRRRPGAAWAVEATVGETTPAGRGDRQIATKTEIATAAAERLGRAETVFLGEGFIGRLIAEALPEGRQLTVLTTSLAVAQTLSGRRGVRVLMPGGRISGSSGAVVGAHGVRMLAEYVIDVVFIEATGISRDGGLTASDAGSGAIKAQLMKSARRKVFCGLHTAFGVVSSCRFADVREIETIVTDSALGSVEAQRYARLGPEVVRV